MATKGKGEGLLFVGKVSVSSLADEQTAAAERRMNGETEASERDIVWQKTRKTQKDLGKLKLGFIFSQKSRKNVPRITCITRIRQAKAWFYILAENAENADFTINFKL